MMKKGKLGKLWAVICAAMACVMVFSLAACTDNGGDEAELKLSAATAQVEVGKTTTVQVDSATTETIEWSSDKTSIATVKGGGQGNKVCTITGVAAGTATVTAKAGDKTATCAVTVKAAQGGETTETVTIKLGDEAVSTDAYNLYGAGDKITFSATASKGSGISWESGDTAVATVSGGVVTAVAAGEAVITAKVSDSVKATVNVKVLAGTPITFSAEDSFTAGWHYWQGEGGSVSSCNSYEDNKVIAINYTQAGGKFYGVQLFYKDRTATKLHDVSFTLVSPVAGSVNVNEAQQDLVVGENEITVEDWSGSAAKDSTLSIQFGIPGGENGTPLTGENLVFKIKDLVVTTKTTAELSAPSFSTTKSHDDEEDKDIFTIAITDDDNTADNITYKLGLFKNATDIEPVAILTVANGDTLNLDSVKTGNYIAKLKAEINSNTTLNSEWSETTETINWNNPGTPINATTTDSWYYDTCGGQSSLTKATIDSEGVINIVGLNQTQTPYAFQLKLNVTKKITSITVTITAENAGYMTFGTPAGSQCEQQISADTQTFTTPALNIEGTLVICFGNNTSWWGDQSQTPVWLLGNLQLSIEITFEDGSKY